MHTEGRSLHPPGCLLAAVLPGLGHHSSAGPTGPPSPGTQSHPDRNTLRQCRSRAGIPALSS